MSNVRKVTHELIEMVDEGIMSWESIAMNCLHYMSEADVKDMAEYNGLIEDNDEEE